MHHKCHLLWHPKCRIYLYTMHGLEWHHRFFLVWGQPRYCTNPRFFLGLNPCALQQPNHCFVSHLLARAFCACTTMQTKGINFLSARAWMWQNAELSLRPTVGLVDWSYDDVRSAVTDLRISSSLKNKRQLVIGIALSQSAECGARAQRNRTRCSTVTRVANKCSPVDLTAFSGCIGIIEKNFWTNDGSGLFWKEFRKTASTRSGGKWSCPCCSRLFTIP